ncbi:MAG: hypothetical protein WD872_21635 [Pirellulaceae bacterium]
MTHFSTGVVVDGMIQLHEPLDLPNQTAVSVAIEPLTAADNDPVAAWERTQQRLRERPIHGGGRRYTRDELHERR